MDSGAWGEVGGNHAYRHGHMTTWSLVCSPKESGLAKGIVSPMDEWDWGT